MNIAVVSRDPKRLKENVRTILRYKKNLGKHPEIVVALGGDGTFLAAERFYPGIPKLLVRSRSICNKCDWDNLGEGLRRLLLGSFSVREFAKIGVRVHDITIEATNDVVVRNTRPTEAVRFRISLDGKDLGEELIGDGIVVSTAFGSEGYFRSIARRHFEKGIGIAFNNLTRKRDPLLLDTPAKITLEITRGEAYVAADNNPELIVVREGEKVVIEQSRNVARIVRLK